MTWTTSLVPTLTGSASGMARCPRSFATSTWTTCTAGFRPSLTGTTGRCRRNIDPTTPDPGFPYQGNLRYRHVDQTKCRVAFADGSVRQFTAVLRPDLTLQSHDALRRHFMTEWPPNTPRNFNVP